MLKTRFFRNPILHLREIWELVTNIGVPELQEAQRSRAIIQQKAADARAEHASQLNTFLTETLKHSASFNHSVNTVTCDLEQQRLDAFKKMDNLNSKEKSEAQLHHQAQLLAERLKSVEVEQPSFKKTQQ